MILPDTSAWIEFLRKTNTPVALRMRDTLAGREAPATTGMILLELLGGARDEREVRDLERLLARCRFLKLEEPLDEEVAAAILRACRRAGHAVRGGPDCLIAAVAIRNGARVLHADKDFDVIAQHSALALVPT